MYAYAAGKRYAFRTTRIRAAQKAWNDSYFLNARLEREAAARDYPSATAAMKAARKRYKVPDDIEYDEELPMRKVARTLSFRGAI